jgi:catalase
MILIRRFVLLLFCLLLLAGCAVLLRNTFASPPVGPQGEYRAPQEDVMMSRLVSTGIRGVNSGVTNGTYHRDAHPKSHGCVSANFEVKPLGWPYNQGMFAKPGTYKAWVRFSSGDPLIQSDWKPDARGMATKVLGTVEQDFVMINNPVFMLRNIEEYSEFGAYQASSAAEHKPFLAFKYFFLGPDNQVTYNPFHWRLREFALGVQILKWPPRSLLKTQFHSMTAYRLGTAGYIKFSARPATCANQSWFDFGLVGFNKNALGQDLADRVKAASYCFDFLIQPQRADKNMPVEDPTVRWKESDSPFINVGRLKIDPQTISADPDTGFCENLSFSPWQGYPEMEPVGGLNRIRKVVYESISAYRHRMNGVEASHTKVE